jgi:hypothetical protein
MARHSSRLRCLKALVFLVRRAEETVRCDRGDDDASRGDDATWEEAATARHEKGWWQREQGQRRQCELGQRRQCELGRWQQREQRLRWQGGGGRRGTGEKEDGGVWAQVRVEDAGRRFGQRQ